MPLHSSMPETIGSVGLEDMSKAELVLPLIRCSTRDSDIYIPLYYMPGQHSRTDLEGVGVEGPTLMTKKQKN